MIPPKVTRLAVERAQRSHEEAERDPSTHDRNGALVRSATPAEPAIGAPKLVTLADVVPENVSWLWLGRIPRGMLTLLDGDPGLGKSTITLDIAARVTRGDSMPLEARLGGAPADVITLGAEDHLAATIRPRLDAAGADVARVHALVAVPGKGDPDKPPVLPEDIGAVETAIRTHGAVLVVIDPLMAFLASETDSYRDQDIRAALRPLAAVAERTGASIVIVRHLRKAAGPALYRGGGSIGIIGAARSALIAARDPDDDNSRLLASSKSNLAAPAATLRWHLEDAGGVARVVWDGEVDGVSADDLAMPLELARNGDDTTLECAVTALRERLASGPVAAKVAMADVCEMANCSARTVRRAREELGVKPQQAQSVNGKVIGWLWKLPDAQVLKGGHLAASGPRKSANGQGEVDLPPDDHGPGGQEQLDIWDGHGDDDE